MAPWEICHTLPSSVSCLVACDDKYIVVNIVEVDPQFILLIVLFEGGGNAKKNNKKSTTERAQTKASHYSLRVAYSMHFVLPRLTVLSMLSTMRRTLSDRLFK